jgi:hypothetical protein
MAEVTVTYDDVQMTEKMNVELNTRDGDAYLVAAENYKFLNDGVLVPEMGEKRCYREILWADAPTAVKDALVTIHNYLYAEAKIDAGL